MVLLESLYKPCGSGTVSTRVLYFIRAPGTRETQKVMMRREGCKDFSRKIHKTKKELNMSNSLVVVMPWCSAEFTKAVLLYGRKPDWEF